jgi:multidrug efflux system membrane fusion protein
MRRDYWAGALLAIAALTACSETSETASAKQPPTPPPAPVTVSQPLQKEVAEWDEFTGRAEAVETVEIRARVTGQLMKVNFKDGAKIAKGDLLFVIDPRPYEAELARAEAEVTRLQASLELAQDDLIRAKRLLKNKAISEEEFDSRSKGLRGAEASLQAAKAAVQSAKLNVEFTHIRAPISGRISREYVTEGNLITALSAQTTPMAIIVSIDPIYVYVDADERSVLKYRRLAREGKRPSARDVQIPVEMQLADEEGFPHKGFVDYVEPRIDASTGTVRARGVFPNPGDQISPGFFARVRVPGTNKYPALLVTDLAIGTDQGRKYVMVANSENIAEYRPVKLGAVIEGLRVINDGIKPTDWVIVNGVQRARPGAPVKPERKPMPDLSTGFITEGAVQQPKPDSSPGKKTKQTILKD